MFKVGDKVVRVSYHSSDVWKSVIDDFSCHHDAEFTIEKVMSNTSIAFIKGLPYVWDTSYFDYKCNATLANDGRYYRIKNSTKEEKPKESKSCDASQIGGSHYKGDSIMNLIEERELSFAEGNVVKYVCRHKDKNGLEDLKKAKWYLERLISRYENK